MTSRHCQPKTNTQLTTSTDQAVRGFFATGLKNFCMLGCAASGDPITAPPVPTLPKGVTARLR